MSIGERRVSLERNFRLERLNERSGNHQAARLRAEVGREVGEIRFSTATRHLPSDEYFEEVLNWQV